MAKQWWQPRHRAWLPSAFQGSFDMAAEFENIIAIWQPSSPAPLTAEDGREIAANVTGFFSLLAEWAEQDALLPCLPADGSLPNSPPGEGHERISSHTAILHDA